MGKIRIKATFELTMFEITVSDVRLFYIYRSETVNSKVIGVKARSAIWEATEATWKKPNNLINRVIPVTEFELIVSDLLAI